jgi:hypothetical protein
MTVAALIVGGGVFLLWNAVRQRQHWTSITWTTATIDADGRTIHVHHSPACSSSTVKLDLDERSQLVVVTVRVSANRGGGAAACGIGSDAVSGQLRQPLNGRDLVHGKVDRGS